MRTLPFGPSSRPRRTLAVLFAALALVLGGLLTAPAAQAAPAALGDLVCPAGNQAVSFSPGLTNTSKTTTITYNATLGVCASLTHPEITSGGSAGTVVAPYSCLDLLNTSTGTQTFTWNTGQSSVLSFTRPSPGP